MKALIGVLPAVISDMVNRKTALVFNDRTKFKTPEALIIHEQSLLPEEKLFEACQIEYNRILYKPVARFVAKEIINKFSSYEVVVFEHDSATNHVLLGTIPEFLDQHIILDEFKIEIVPIPIYLYVKLHTKQFGRPSFLKELPIKDKWDFIIDEAIRLGAADITITNTAVGAKVYYNVRKRKVESARAINPEDVKPLLLSLASSASATLADDSSRPRYFAIDVNRNYRGRVVINKTYYGLLGTIRMLSNKMLDLKLEDLNINPQTCEFIRSVTLSPEPGLRLFIGETMSGKNTTILSALKELVDTNQFKIVSLEQPVEILVDGIEQINAETDEEFELNADSLLRQNPDIVYFTEITGRTGTTIMQQCNTAKAVFSSIHANSISDVLFRLQDITHMPIDTILLRMQSCVYQELVRDDETDTIKPYNRCVYFDEQLKMRLYGKSTAEVVGILRDEELRWGR